MSTRVHSWGKLVRNGGTETTSPVPGAVIPELMDFFDDENFFGRLSQIDASKFDHKVQTAIPCAFLSSTHFSVYVEHNDDSDDKYFVKDFSRNGTFIRRLDKTNGNSADSLIGMGNVAPIYPGDSIVLKFRNEAKLIYTFTADKMGATDKFADENIAPNDTNESLRLQISALQQENKNQEQRLAASLAKCEQMESDLSAALRESRTLAAVITTKDAEIAAMTDSLRGAEANTAAAEARCRRLEEQYEEARLEITTLKGKVSSLNDDIRHKSGQVESRDRIIEETNQTLDKEKAAKREVEAELRATQGKLQQTEEQCRRFKALNRGLHDDISLLETQLQAANVSMSEVQRTFPWDRVSFFLFPFTIVPVFTAVPPSLHIIVLLRVRTHS
jgi:major membrane immunogen (membrane-anchored lipoprotein)